MTVIDHPEKFYVTFGPHKPAMNLKSGQSLQVTVPDCDGYGPDGKVMDRHRFESSLHAPIMVGNPLAGPYYIEEAQPGDSLGIHIEKIVIEQDFGRTGISTRQIHIPAKLLVMDQDVDFNVAVPRQIRRWHIHHASQTASLPLENSRKAAIEVPLAPFPGCIAVAPENGQFIHSLRVGNFGGNIDIPALTVGSCIHLPVFCSGALVFLGDLHAAQGDGEIIGGAIEVGGTITVRVELHKKKTLAYPRFENAAAIGTIGAAETLQNAFDIAYAQLILWLVQDFGFNRWDAFHLVSQTVQARPGNYHSAICTLHKQWL